MARFRGAIGIGTSTEVAPGVYDDVVIEVEASGDVIHQASGNVDEGNVNTNLDSRTRLSVVYSRIAPDPSFNYSTSLKYVVWQGRRWSVTHYEFEPPRIIIYLGEIYNGVTP